MSEAQQPLDQLEQALGYRFGDRGLLERALTHRSYTNEPGRRGTRNYERLEFLGDSILGLVVSEHIFLSYPGEPEGNLSKTRSFVVNEKTLARIAQQRLDLGAYLFVGKGEENTQGRAKPSLLADALEAIFAAIYLDHGFEPVRNVILQLLQQEIDDVVQGRNQRDYKTELQEYTQSCFGQTPRYEIVDQWGPDHQKTFCVSLRIDDREYGRGEGSSKKRAEQVAARKALETLTRSLSQPGGKSQ